MGRFIHETGGRESGQHEREAESMGRQWSPTHTEDMSTKCCQLDGKWVCFSNDGGEVGSRTQERKAAWAVPLLQQGWDGWEGGGLQERGTSPSYQMILHGKSYLLYLGL